MYLWKPLESVAKNSRFTFWDNRPRLFGALNLANANHQDHVSDEDVVALNET